MWLCDLFELQCRVKVACCDAFNWVWLRVSESVVRLLQTPFTYVCDLRQGYLQRQQRGRPAAARWK